MAIEKEKSQNQQLADYIKRNLSKGYTLDSLRFALMNQGYSRTSIEKAIELANKQLAEQAPKMQEKPIIKYEVVDEEEIKRKIAEQESSKNFLKRIWNRIFK